MLPIKRQISRYNHNSGRNSAIKYIVVHDVGQNGSTAKNNADYFGRNENQQASAHYFVDEKSIYQVVEDCDTAWHCGDGRGKYGITNGNSIGIEMIVTNYAISDSTISHTIDLVKMLQAKYGIDNAHVVRHYDASRKNCPQYLNTDGKWTGWTAFKARLTGAITPTPAQPAKHQTGIGANLTNKATYQKTDAVVNVRTSQTTQSKIIKTLPKGTVFKSGRYADGEDVDGHAYKWFEVDGSGWVYGGLITPTSAPVAKRIAEDGYWGGDTTGLAQEILGVPVDRKLGPVTWRAIQKAVGAKEDGLPGPDTYRHMQRHFGTPVDGRIDSPSMVVKAMQKRLNQNKF